MNKYLTLLFLPIALWSCQPNSKISFDAGKATVDGPAVVINKQRMAKFFPELSDDQLENQFAKTYKFLEKQLTDKSQTIHSTAVDTLIYKFSSFSTPQWISFSKNDLYCVVLNEYGQIIPVYNPMNMEEIEKALKTKHNTQP